MLWIGACAWLLLVVFVVRFFYVSSWRVKRLEEALDRYLLAQRTNEQNEPQPSNRWEEIPMRQKVSKGVTYTFNGGEYLCQEDHLKALISAPNIAPAKWQKL